METTGNNIESLIAAVLGDIRQKGYSSIQPFSVGKEEMRMIQFAQVNNITLASDELYMSAKQLQHCMRASKGAKGLVVDDADLIAFPQSRFQMDLYYDGECFIYTDGFSKFIVHPNYQMKVSREVVKLVNFITATKRTDKKKRQGRIAHHHADATVPHIVALLGFSFHVAKIGTLFQKCKFLRDFL